MRAVHVLPFLISAVLAYLVLDNGMVKPVSFSRAPKKPARPLRKAHFHAAEKRGDLGVLLPRQDTCEDSTQFVCKEFDGCCDAGTICGLYGGEAGCCPEGQSCDAVTACAENETACGYGCCTSGFECVATQDGRVMECVSPGATTSMTSATSKPTPDPKSDCPSDSFEKCPKFDGCCPKGVDCLEGGLCDIKCTASDPKCGTGCCLKGYECNEQAETCFEIASDVFSSSTKATDLFNTKKTTATPRPTKTADQDELATTEGADPEPTEKPKKSDGSSFHNGGGSVSWMACVEGIFTILLVGFLAL